MPMAHIQPDSRRFILVIDDNISDRSLYCAWLEQSLEGNAIIMAADSLQEAKTTLESCRPDCIILDHQLLDGTGMDYLKYLTEYYGNMPPIVVFISGIAEEDLGKRAVSNGAVTFIPKNKLNPNLLHLAVRRILQDGEVASI